MHAECRISGDTVYVLEVAARPIGGLCSRALRFRPGGPQVRSGSLHPSTIARGAVSEVERQASGETDALVSLEEVLLRHALGEDVSLYVRERAASGVMMIPIPKRGVYRRVDGLDEAKQVAGIEDVRITAKPDTTLVPLPEGDSYLGFIFASGPSPEAVEAALREAHKKLHFQVESLLPMVS